MAPSMTYVFKFVKKHWWDMGLQGELIKRGEPFSFLLTRERVGALFSFIFFCFLGLQVRFSRNNQQNLYLNLHIVDD